MKGKKWKVLYGLFLGVVSCLLYNTLFTLKNASAAVVDLSGFDIVSSTAAATIQICTTRNLCGTETGWNQAAWTQTVKTPQVYGIRTSYFGDFKQGDILEYNLVIRSNWDPNYLTPYMDTRILATSNGNFGYLGYDVIWDSSTDQAGDAIPANVGGTLQYNINNESYLYKVIKFTAVARREGRFQISLGSIDNNANWVLNFRQDNNLTTNGYQITFLDAILYRKSNSAVEEEAQKELEDRNNLESQSQQTSGDANSAEQQMSSGTSSLISVVTSFSNAMIGVRRTNCKLPRMTAYDFDLGELDLCTYSPPAWIQTITSAVVSLIIVRLAYKIFKRIMGIAKGISK